MRGGASVRAIEERLRAEGIPVSKSTVGRIAMAAQKGPVKPTTTPAKRTEPSPPPLEEPLSDEVVATFEGQTSLQQLTRIASRYSARIDRAIETGELQVLQRMTPLLLQVNQMIARVRPPEIPDPASDPSNLAARDQVRARIALLVAEAENTEAARAALRAHLDRLDEAAARAA